MQHRPAGADHELDRLLEREVAHVSLAQLDRQASGAFARHGEHRRRTVDADHALPRLARDGDRDPAGAYSELDDRLGSLAGELDVPRNVRCHRGRPPVIILGVGVVFAHPGIVPVMQVSARRFMQPRLEAGAPARQQ
jgi:hypothetical protein